MVCIRHISQDKQHAKHTHLGEQTLKHQYKHRWT